ncbi:imidazolonepropionase [Candidatus Koribacter versatilis Ellin345]|uniref:Imidazolonepropionase n=1 Tax=Koribacter versatilis (strain Ellin345) TaxID=204669 RepID=Q1ISU8_KORVE|nr:imidazolonepropionase [Candidatus Koribacter versatilis]ABF40052.1 imidazolonepropionase [Candidatus Koribacter versatilis Ellin345]
MPKDSAILLRDIRQLLTLRSPSAKVGPRRGKELSELGVIENGAVLVRDGEFVAVGTTREVLRIAKREAKKVQEISCRDQVVLPGFVDSHTHPVFAAPRLIDFEKRITGANYEQIAEAGGGIRSSIRGVRESSRSVLTAKVLGAFEEMAAHGTTTIEAKSGYGLDFDSEIKSLEAIRSAARKFGGTVIATLLGAHTVPPEHRAKPEKYVRIICEEMIPTAARKKLAKYVDVFCERGAFTPEQSERILRTARDHGLEVRAHVNQLTEVGLERFDQFAPASYDHMDKVSAGDIQRLSKADMIATLLPAANYFLGLSEYPPARKLIDAGVAVALATDYNPGTAPTASMPFVLSAACTHMKLSPAEAIVAGTFNGACALRLQGSKGSIEPGKDADLAIFDADNYREVPYWFGVNRCSATMLNGSFFLPANHSKV